MDRHLLQVLLAPAILLLLSLVLFPTIYLFWLSLSEWDASSGAPTFVGLENFRQLLFEDTLFWSALWRSALFVILGVAIELVLGLAIAMLLNTPMRGIAVVRMLLLAPMAMTPIVVGMLWLILYNPSYGLINYLLSLVGIPAVEWTSNPRTALFALVLVDVWQWTPFMFLILSAGLLSIPVEVSEAAKVDGATSWREFWHITLPLLRRIMLVAILIRAVDIWKVFDTIFALTKGGPGTATQTLNFYAYTQSFQWFHLGYGAALMVVGITVTLVFANLFLRAAPDIVEGN
jgi:multiple sugar transport system permease protein